MARPGRSLRVPRKCLANTPYDRTRTPVTGTFGHCTFGPYRHCEPRPSMHGTGWQTQFTGSRLLGRRDTLRSVQAQGCIRLIAVFSTRSIMVLMRVQYDAYNRQFRVSDRELARTLQDGETYVLIADFSVKDLAT